MSFNESWAFPLSLKPSYSRVQQGNTCRYILKYLDPSVEPVSY